jgi:cysteine desulfurase
MENTPGIVAMAAAIGVSLATMADRAALHWGLTDRLRTRIADEVAGATVHGHPTHRVPHLVGFSVAGLDAATLLMALDDRGFRVGAGSLCTGRPEDPSPVLERIGFPATTSFRVSLSGDAAEAQVDGFVDALAGIAGELRRMESVSAEAIARLTRTAERPAAR